MRVNPKTGTSEHQALGIRAIEVKDPMPIAAYAKLASILTCNEDPECVAAHCNDGVLC